MQGGCLCGNVVYEVGAPFDFLASCHCSMCRKHHGTAFMSWLGAGAAGFRVVRGAERISRYESSPGFQRAFCRDCGAKLPVAVPDEPQVVLPAGTLEGDPGLRPMAHIFVASKAPWHEISDRLPRFDAYPPGVSSAEVAVAPRAPAPAGRPAGSCLCGEVRYELDGSPDLIRHCHCSRCRRQRGSAHATNAVARLDRFRWTRGAGLVDEYKLPAARYFAHSFCRACGSSVPRVSDDRGIVVVPAGGFDGDPGVRAGEHIFVGSKAPWFEITDALPQYAEAAPSAPRRTSEDR